MKKSDQYENDLKTMPVLNQEEDKSYVENNTPEKVKERLKKNLP